MYQLHEKKTISDNGQFPTIPAIVRFAGRLLELRLAGPAAASCDSSVVIWPEVGN
jgi:hypothetical protein